MSLLAIDAGATRVTALVVSGSGEVTGRATQELVEHVPQPGWVEHEPEEVWQATLAATRAVLSQVDATEVLGLGVTSGPAAVVLWDRDTLGSPRRVIAGADRRTAEICARLREGGHEPRVVELTGTGLDAGSFGTGLVWLQENEPHTWALVESGRYAVGTVDSYLVARMTRGLEHLTDVSHASRTSLLDVEHGAWSPEVSGLLGVPLDALPELVPSWGEVAVTEPRTFLGLALPVAGLAGERSTTLVGQCCFEPGEVACTVGDRTSVLTPARTPPPHLGPALRPIAAWRSASGELVHALEGPVTGTAGAALAAMPVPPTSVRVGGPAADDVRCRSLADELGVAVQRARVAETNALGAAYLAGLGTGVWGSTDDLREVWPAGARFEPVGRR